MTEERWVRFDPPIPARISRQAAGFGDGYLEGEDSLTGDIATLIYAASFSEIGFLGQAVIPGVQGLRSVSSIGLKVARR